MTSLVIAEFGDPMIGAFDLSSPRDLLEKLRRECERLHKSPDNVDHAFNFFVTAEHMLDWLFPGGDKTARTARESQRASDVLLEVVSHLANGAKHFDRLSPHHKSVTTAARRGGYFAPGYFAENWFPRGFFAKPSLVVDLSGQAANQLGSSIGAVELADLVLAYWEGSGRVP